MFAITFENVRFKARKFVKNAVLLYFMLVLSFSGVANANVKSIDVTEPENTYSVGTGSLCVSPELFLQVFREAFGEEMLDAKKNPIVIPSPVYRKIESYSTFTSSISENVFFYGLMQPDTKYMEYITLCLRASLEEAKKGVEDINIFRTVASSFLKGVSARPGEYMKLSEVLAQVMESFARSEETFSDARAVVLQGGMRIRFLFARFEGREISIDVVYEPAQG